MCHRETQMSRCSVSRSGEINFSVNCHINYPHSVQFEMKESTKTRGFFLSDEGFTLTHISTFVRPLALNKKQMIKMWDDSFALFFLYMRDLMQSHYLYLFMSQNICIYTTLKIVRRHHIFLFSVLNVSTAIYTSYTTSCPN